MNRPLLVTRDDSLLDELLRLAAAAGTTPDVAHDPPAALRGWTAAPVVVVGVDLAAETARLAPERRPGVHVVGWGDDPPEVYRQALRLGAESVLDLPGAASWIGELLGDLGDLGDLGESGEAGGAGGRGRPGGPARATVIGVLGGAGGAGATTLACALGQVAARTGPCLVVDLDPLGPGADRILGLESVPGARWDALARAGGRLGARALREALPRQGPLGVLTWGATREAPDAESVREVLSAARRGHRTVVVDLPRTGDACVEETLSRCDTLIVVVAPTVVGTASATRLLARLPDPSRARLVLRGIGIDARDIETLTGTPVLLSMRDQRGLAEDIDLGLGPARSLRTPLGRAAAEVLRGTIKQIAA